MSTTSTTSTTNSPFGIGSGLSTAPGTTSSSSSANTLNASSFMTLFLAQLQNQDPTNPMQSYELAAQLAQFTTVQELSQNTSLLSNLQQYTAAVNNGEVASLIGQQVSAQLNTINVSSGTPSALNYTLPASGTVSITIKNSEGSTIDTLSLGSQSAGNLQRAMDGQGLERQYGGRRRLHLHDLVNRFRRRFHDNQSLRQRDGLFMQPQQ